MLVSVDAIITDAVFEILQSAPYTLKISVRIAIDPLPEIGLKNDNILSSDGMLNKSKTGFEKLVKISSPPDALSIAQAHITARMLGKIFIPVVSESLAPIVKVSKTFFFFAIPIKTIKKIKQGTIYSEKLN